MSFERYSFCFLRYVHEPLSGEFANVGVLLWAPESGFLGFRASRKSRRLRRFFQGFRPADHRPMLGRIESEFRQLASRFAAERTSLPFSEVPTSARDLALKVIPHDDAALQWGWSGGGLTDSPVDELERLYQEAIGRHDESDEDGGRDDDAVYREVFKRAFESPVVKRWMAPHEVTAPLASHLFPQAWKNGEWNVYQPLSFDLKQGEAIRNKAYRWESLTRHLAQSPERPRIHLLLGRPPGAKGAAYKRATDILRSSAAVELIEEDEAEDFASDLEARVRNLE